MWQDQEMVPNVALNKKKILDAQFGVSLGCAYASVSWQQDNQQTAQPNEGHNQEADLIVQPAITLVRLLQHCN